MPALQQELPIPPVVDDHYIQTLDPDFRDGLLNPFDFGYRSGEEWVQTVNIENIHEAVVRPTVNEQMDKKFDIYYRRFVVGDEDFGDSEFNMDVIEPTYFVGDFDSAISDFFKKMQAQYYFFNGYDELDQSDKQIERHGYEYSDAPNYRFRAFEDGWTKAVRDFYRSLMNAYQLSNTCSEVGMGEEMCSE